MGRWPGALSERLGRHRICTVSLARGRGCWVVGALGQTGKDQSRNELHSSGGSGEADRESGHLISAHWEGHRHLNCARSPAICTNRG